MLTWQVDRLLRSGPLCAVATFVVPALLAALVNATSDVENILGLLLVAAGITAIGTLSGSMVTSGFGVLLFGAGAVLGEVSPLVLLTVGSGLFATLMIHDLSGSFRRAPKIGSGVWTSTARTTLALVAIGAAAFAIAYAVAGLVTWPSIAVPFGFAAIGISAKLAADAHADTTRRYARSNLKRR